MINSAIRVRGTIRESDSWRVPLTLTLSRKRGEGEVSAAKSGERER